MNDTTSSSSTPSTQGASSTGLTSPPPPTVWACVNYTDARAAIRLLVDVFGFVETGTHARDDDPSIVVHSELRWPEGGGIMLGTAGRADSEFSRMPTGCASTYVVTDRPREIHASCVEAGVEIVQGLREEDYGSLGFSARDAEGNIWSFGTYRGE